MTTNVTTPPLPALKAQAEVESAGGILDHVPISDLLTPPDNDHIYGQIRPRWTALIKHYHSTGINVWKGMLNNEPPSIGKNRMRKL